MLLHFSTGKYFHQCIHMWLVYCVHINICPFNDMYCGLCNGLWSNSWHIFLCVTGRTSKPDMGVFDRFLHARILSFFFLPAPFLPLPLVLFVLFLCLRTFDCAFSLRACAVPVARSFVLVLQFACSSLRIPKTSSLVPFFCVCVPLFHLGCLYNSVPSNTLTTTGTCGSYTSFNTTYALLSSCAVTCATNYVATTTSFVCSPSGVFDPPWECYTG